MKILNVSFHDGYALTVEISNEQHKCTIIFPDGTKKEFTTTSPTIINFINQQSELRRELLSVIEPNPKI